MIGWLDGSIVWLNCWVVGLAKLLCKGILRLDGWMVEKLDGTTVVC
jgi:hypothetical protein